MPLTKYQVQEIKTVVKTQIECCCNSEFGTTILNPPIAAPAQGEPVVLVGESIWKWNGSAWADLLGGSGGELGYLVYTALLNQSGTDDPTVIVLGDNTIGNIVWTRTTEGNYEGELLGAFPLARTLLLVGDNLGVNHKINFENIEDGEPSNKVRISTRVVADNTGADSRLYYTSIEIRVYPV